MYFVFNPIICLLSAYYIYIYICGFAGSFKNNNLIEQMFFWDWGWIEDVRGVILPRVLFREMVWFLSEFHDFFFMVKTSSDDGVVHSWQGPFFFFQKSMSPFKKTRILLFWGILFFEIETCCVKIETLYQ